jgi:hypothetical protein
MSKKRTFSTPVCQEFWNQAYMIMHGPSFKGVSLPRIRMKRCDTGWARYSIRLPGASNSHFNRGRGGRGCRARADANARGSVHRFVTIVT